MFARAASEREPAINSPLIDKVFHRPPSSRATTGVIRESREVVPVASVEDGRPAPGKWRGITAASEANEESPRACLRRAGRPANYFSTCAAVNHSRARNFARPARLVSVREGISRKADYTTVIDRNARGSSRLIIHAHPIYCRSQRTVDNCNGIYGGVSYSCARHLHRFGRFVAGSSFERFGA